MLLVERPGRLASVLVDDHSSAVCEGRYGGGQERFHRVERGDVALFPLRRLFAGAFLITYSSFLITYSAFLITYTDRPGDVRKLYKNRLERHGSGSVHVISGSVAGFVYAFVGVYLALCVKIRHASATTAGTCPLPRAASWSN